MLFFISPEHLEAFQNCLNRWYVDMLFFISPENLEAFQNCLNGRHANMSFAIGNEKQSRMSFLDVQVIREDKTFTKCIYRTFSGVYKHIYSFLTSAYMFGTAYLLAYRCFKICSCWTKLHTELSSLKQYFLKKMATLKISQVIVSRDLQITTLTVQKKFITWFNIFTN